MALAGKSCNSIKQPFVPFKVQPFSIYPTWPQQESNLSEKKKLCVTVIKIITTSTTTALTQRTLTNKEKEGN